MSTSNGGAGTVISGIILLSFADTCSIVYYQAGNGNTREPWTARNGLN